MRILLTNDDGIFAVGLTALAEALEGLGELVVVAPDREQSATSHSLTLHRPLRARQEREHWYAVDGTPTDCVNLAVQGILKESPPDLVVSGINLGPNMGEDVNYSGTVSAAFEGCMHQVPAVAFSQEGADEIDFADAARLARRLLDELLRDGLPERMLLNVNLPKWRGENGELCKGVRVTRLGKRFYHQTVIEKTDPKGRKYYWIGGKPEWLDEPGSDHEAVSQGYVSMTPLHLDMTDYGSLERWRPVGERIDEQIDKSS